jgi:hypothetical protein
MVARGEDRRLDPLASLAYRGIGQADDVEPVTTPLASRDMGFDPNWAGIDADERG